jgi:iron complex transport system ATP-binding protein
VTRDGRGEGPIVDAAGVSKRLGGVEILSDVDFAVEAGQFVGLVGPNGAGKTTLLRCLNGVLAPDRGSVAVAGEDVGDLSARETGRLVATVPQDTHLSFAFDVRQVVSMGRNPYVSRFGSESAADREAVDRALARTETEHLADREIDAVSGGERQRVVLARALAQETPVLLLDEPTASLDVNHQVRTLELVADLVADGKTAVAAIHDLNLAAHYCDELVLLADGSVLDAGDPEAVLTERNLEAAFDTRAAVTSHPVTGSTYVTALPERDGDRGTRVHVVAGGGTGSRLLYLLDAAGFRATAGALSPGDADLETARQLGIDAVETAPYAPVDDAAERAVRERVREADVTVVADVEVGPGNLPNLRAASEADRLVVVEQRPFVERNHAGDEGRRAYETLRRRGRVVDADELIAAVELAAAGDAPAGTEPAADDALADGEGD